MFSIVVFLKDASNWHVVIIKWKHYGVRCKTILMLVYITINFCNAPNSTDIRSSNHNVATTWLDRRAGVFWAYSSNQRVANTWFSIRRKSIYFCFIQEKFVFHDLVEMFSRKLSLSITFWDSFEKSFQRTATTDCELSLSSKTQTRISFAIP